MCVNDLNLCVCNLDFYLSFFSRTLWSITRWHYEDVNFQGRKVWNIWKKQYLKQASMAKVQLNPEFWSISITQNSTLFPPFKKNICLGVGILICLDDTLIVAFLGEILSFHLWSTVHSPLAFGICNKFWEFALNWKPSQQFQSAKPFIFSFHRKIFAHNNKTFPLLPWRLWSYGNPADTELFPFLQFLENCA